jgi:hypothetical protein
MADRTRRFEAMLLRGKRAHEPGRAAPRLGARIRTRR